MIFMENVRLKLRHRELIEKSVSKTNRKENRCGENENGESEEHK